MRIFMFISCWDDRRSPPVYAIHLVMRLLKLHDDCGFEITVKISLLCWRMTKGKKRKKRDTPPCRSFVLNRFQSLASQEEMLLSQSDFVHLLVR